MSRSTAEHRSLHTRTVGSAVGPLVIVGGDAGLRAVLWGEEDRARVRLGPVDDGGHEVLDDAADQLLDYLAGRRRRFDLALDLVGTPFQVRVWQALDAVPYGCTASYREIAAAVGSPAAVRAVGAAVGRNPVSLVLPCHRVVGADGRLTGFAGGLAAKRHLLDLERGVVAADAERLGPTTAARAPSTRAAPTAGT